MPRIRAAATAGAITEPPIPSTTSGRKRSTIRRPARSEAGTRYGRARFFHTASRSSPRMLTVARSKPEAGTSRSSGPPVRPTRSSAPSGSSARNARATASAGNRCPPVPPPAINSLICSPQRRSCATPGDEKQNTTRRKLGRHRRPAVAEERQRYSRDGQGVGHRRHVQQRFKADPRRDRSSEPDAEAVRRAQRRAVAPQAEKQETEHHQGGADEAGLLAEDGEDEVGVGFRQPAVLLDGVADADPKPAARRKAVEGLRGLKAGAQRIREGVFVRGEPGEQVRLAEHDIAQTTS